MEQATLNTQDNGQRVKNLSALAVVLVGLFIGSLFVDFVQLTTGKGFSGHVIRTHNLLEAEGKTWVAFADPKVSVDILTEKDCKECDYSEALVWLQRVVPTLEATEIEVGSPTGQALVQKFGIMALPAFVFSQNIEQTDFFAQAESLFQSENGRYFFNMAAIGLPIGKYLKLPELKEDTIVVGPRDAKVRVVEYSDFQCPYCKTFQADLSKVLSEYGDRVTFVYKHLPLSIHPQAENAALASECANEQGKFQVYADYLFRKQDEWGARVGTQRFNEYAWYLRLDGRKFSQCLESGKYRDKVAADAAEAETFFVSGTPGTFVNGRFFGGVASADELKAAIDEELAK